MQHIPHHSLEDLERSRAEMEAFRENLRKEKHVWDDDDERVITAVKCPKCEQMIGNLKNHFCV